VAVASGNGSFPCISATKYRRNGIRNRTPRSAPRSGTMKIWRKLEYWSSPRM
jgi:hypothetical protein